MTFPTDPARRPSAPSSRHRFLALPRHQPQARRGNANRRGLASPAGWKHNRLASLLDGIARGFIDDPEFVDIIRRDLQEGQHRGVPGTTTYFTTAYFHRPEELTAEIGESGFRRRGLCSVQGPARFAPDLEARMANPARRAQLLDLIRLVEQEEALLGAASHIAFIAEKRAQDT